MDSDSLTDKTPGNAKRMLGSIGIVIIVVAVAFGVYTVRSRDRMASQALHLTSVFIKSSPVVEKDLGSVISIKESSEKRVDGRRWMVDYTVTGKKARGTVDFVLKKTDGNWGSWKYLEANLKTGEGKTSNLL